MNDNFLKHMKSEKLQGEFRNDTEEESLNNFLKKFMKNLGKILRSELG